MITALAACSQGRGEPVGPAELFGLQPQTLVVAGAYDELAGDPQDLAERKYWDAYQQRYQEVLRATSTLHAPWYVVPADSKTHRNLMVANVVLETLQKLKLKFPDPKPELKDLKFD